jgi:hypothetical protein
VTFEINGTHAKAEVGQSYTYTTDALRKPKKENIASEFRN